MNPPGYPGTPSTGDTGMDPVLPIFIQMNSRLVEEDDQWKESSRWVKFQENVEDGGKRWSKPHVPSCTLSVFRKLREHLKNSPILLDAQSQDIASIVDEVMQCPEASWLDRRQKTGIHDLFQQDVKQKMKISFVRQISKHSTTATNSDFSRQESGYQDGNNDNLSAPTSPEPTLKDYSSDPSSAKNSRHNTLEGPTRSYANKYRKNTLMMRDYNLFSKKVPKNAEAFNIQVATCSFLSEPFIAFIRLKTPVILDDLTEISKPTRFLALVLGPEGSAASMMELGRAFGTLLTDQLFCQLTAYRATAGEDVLKGLDTYLGEMTVLPPAAWDPTIRLDPPKSTSSVQVRLQNRAFNEDNNEDEDEMVARHLKLGDAIDHQEDESLKFTGRLFGGLVKDVKRKAPWFVSDFTDAFKSPQTLASIIYIYLATVTKAITFGGFLGDVTDDLQGVLESFMGHALAGGVFCLLGGQPLTVLGCTGPVLIFEKILFAFCTDNDVDYLTMRLWIGLWTTLLCIVIVAVDGSAIVKYFTRFTEEAFACLIGLIFIIEALKKLFKTGKHFKVHKHYLPDMRTMENPCRCLAAPEGNSTLVKENTTEIEKAFLRDFTLTRHGTDDYESVGEESLNWTTMTYTQCKGMNGILEGDNCNYVPDIFFFSVILFVGTFFFCMSLKKFKYTTFFPSKVRSMISDYAVIITIILFVLVDQYYALDTPKLLVPTEFKPTRSDVRGWLIKWFDDSSPWWYYLLCVIPAILLTILLFMDQQITSVIVNRKEHKLKKGCGYHLDMLIVGVMMGVCSVLGLPWCVAATVLCLGHVDSLKMDTESSAPGETPQFLGVRENRVTGVCVFILTGLSVKLAPILKYIPMSVLYGVLMYMGVNTLNGMQFMDRIYLLFMPTKHQPDYLYLRHVPLKKVHLFTAIQIFSLAALWIIKSTSASLIFPLLVLAMVGFRKAMDFIPRVFSQNDLFWLDNLMPQSKKSKEKKMKKKGKDAGSVEVNFKVAKNGDVPNGNAENEEAKLLTFSKTQESNI